MAVTFDDHAFDVEIIADRLGGGMFSKKQFAEVLGYSRQSIWAYVKRGKLPAPACREYAMDARGHIQPQVFWTAEQVAEVLLARAEK